MEGHLTYPLSAGEARGHTGAAGFGQLSGGRTFRAPLPLRRLLQGMAIAGAVTLIAGAFLAPARTWANLLLAGNYVLGLALGGLVFVALHYVCGASWSTAFRRVPEAMAALLCCGGASRSERVT